MGNPAIAAMGNIILFILILGLASQVDWAEFKQRFSKPYGIGIGLLCQFIILPLAGLASCRLFFPNNPVYGIPLLVTVCSPGGSYSNWWCSLFNSDLPLSMAMTTASSLLAVGTLPVNIMIYLAIAYPNRGDDGVEVAWAGLFTSLAMVVFGIGFGLLAGFKRPEWRENLGRLGNVAGVSLVLLGVFFSSNSSRPIWARPLEFYVGVGVPCVVGLLVALVFAFACGLPKPHCLSVTIETAYQNTAIPLAVILSTFSNEDEAMCDAIGMRASDVEGEGGGAADCDVIGVAAGVPTFYQVVQVVSLSILCLAGWKSGWTYAPPHHSLWRILSDNYQPIAGDDEPDDEGVRLAHGGSTGSFVHRDLRARRRHTRSLSLGSGENFDFDAVNFAELGAIGEEPTAENPLGGTAMGRGGGRGRRGGRGGGHARTRSDGGFSFDAALPPHRSSPRKGNSLLRVNSLGDIVEDESPGGSSEKKLDEGDDGGDIVDIEVVDLEKK
jgi:sodium/bile acid cotransporter 2